MPYQPLPNLWDDAKASKLDAVDQLVYRSNLLGSDPRITNYVHPMSAWYDSKTGR